MCVFQHGQFMNYKDLVKFNVKFNNWLNTRETDKETCCWEIWWYTSFSVCTSIKNWLFNANRFGPIWNFTRIKKLLLFQSVELRADAKWANFAVKSNELSFNIKVNCRSTSEPVDWMLSSWWDIIILEEESWAPIPPSFGKLPRNEESESSGSHECSLMPPGGDGGGEFLLGVCSNELLEFSRTESRKWSTWRCDGVDVAALDDGSMSQREFSSNRESPNESLSLWWPFSPTSSTSSICWRSASWWT